MGVNIVEQYSIQKIIIFHMAFVLKDLLLY